MAIGVSQAGDIILRFVFPWTPWYRALLAVSPSYLAMELFALALKDLGIKEGSQAAMQSSQPEVLPLLAMTSGIYLNVLQNRTRDGVYACI